MQTRPEQPPEGKLIAAAAERLELSIREAARRAGISYGRWRQITTGYQNTSPGEFAVVRAPAKTLAKMARVVGVTPEQLETEGQRPDAAEAMRHDEAAPVPQLAPIVTGVPVIDNAASPEDVGPFLWQIRNEIDRARRQYGDPTGEQVFGPGQEANTWDRGDFSEDVKIALLATFRLFAFKARSSEAGGSKAGLRVLPGGA